jgi:hypothetical protein
MKTDFNENVTNEDMEFRDVLRDLKTTDIPSDFGFRVKAKIAIAKGSKGKFGIFAFLKVAAPMALLICIGLFAVSRFGLQKTEVVDIVSAPKIQVEEPTIQSNVEPAEPEIPSVAARSNRTMKPESSSESEIPAVTIAKTDISKLKNPVLKGKNNLPKSEDNRIFERNSALSIRKTLPNSKGFENKPVTALDAVNPNLTGIDIKDIFKDIGIEAESSNDKWIVKSVKKSSLADRSGVLPKDVLESFDDQKLVPKESKVKSFSGKILTVSREGIVVELKLKP